MESSKKMRVICNPQSGGGDYEPDEIRAWLKGFDLQWSTTKKPGEAAGIARNWRGGPLLVIGGDGTINEVVNGLGRAGFPEEVTLAILPSGTGNDLAATLAIPEDRKEAVATVKRGEERKLDVAHVSSSGIGERFFINVATGGFGAEASSVNDGDLKSRWGKLSYLRAALEVASRFEVRDTHLILDGEERSVRAVNIAVGNCRYAGGGWLAAPEANPEDGLLDLVVIEEPGMKEILELAPAALSDGDYLDRDGVYHARAKSIHVETSPGGLEFTVDGEVIGDEPVDFRVIPGALRVIVGADYVPEPGRSGRG